MNCNILAKKKKVIFPVLDQSLKHLFKKFPKNKPSLHKIVAVKSSIMDEYSKYYEAIRRFSEY